VIKDLRILFVEDDPYIAHSVGKVLKEFGSFQHASNLTQALNLLDSFEFDIAIIDLNLSQRIDLKGLNVLEKVKQKNIYSIILSNYENSDVIKTAYQIGCDHFLDKNKFSQSLAPYLKQFKTRKNFFDWEKIFKTQFITEDPALKTTIKNLLNMKLKDKCFLIEGETGVGKTFLAKFIHEAIDKNSSFVSYNCSQVPETLIDAEIFGYAKGAFSGAETSHEGLLKRANGGVLFLDEIATMPLYTQQKLLKAIEEKEFTPLGANKSEKVSFTLISATCENLSEKIEAKKFRQDFYFRIAGFEILIPPLRNRKEDIELQVYHFIAQSERRFFIEENIIKIFKNCLWPGNTRQLKKVIEKLSEASEGIISEDHPVIQRIALTKDFLPDDFLTKEQKSFIYEQGLKNFVKKIEQDMVQEVMRNFDGKIAKSISTLQISSSSFYRILKEKRRSV
jgi:DNA-binding NtrC family response regulator